MEINNPDVISDKVCRSCGSDQLKIIISLGELPLANSLLEKEQLGEEEKVYPLDLVFCKKCSLVQITETISPEELFSDYLYFSSFSDSLLQHSESLVKKLIAERALTDQSSVIEIGSNDGYLLQFYKKRNIPVIGIDPAQNLCEFAKEEHGIDSINEYFSDDLAKSLVQKGISADVIHANNVLAHVPDLNGFIRGIYKLLKNNGVCIIEVPYVKELIDNIEYDTIYHEHLCYFSLSSLESLFARNHLFINDLELIDTHGGSLRLYVGKKNICTAEWQNQIQKEQDIGIDDFSFYYKFGKDVRKLTEKLRNVILKLSRQGEKIAVYGASAKGTILLNTIGIEAAVFDYVVDKNTNKQGLFIPGLHLPILPTSKLIESMPGFVLLTTWNLRDEILDQQSEYRSRGGKFIIPLPEIIII
jgi:SAM-dependent methyltransferase